LSNRQESFLDKSIKLDSFDGHDYHEVQLPVNNENQYLWFVTDDSNESFICQIIEDPGIAPLTPMQEIDGLAGQDFPSGIKINGRMIEIPESKLVISSPIVIPEGYEVVFNAGAELDMIEGAFFLSHSSVKIKGEANNPVLIGSSDGTSQGFIIMQAQDRSIVNYAHFSRLNTLSYKGWQLTGAVNFYESNVNVSNTLFTNNLCEDALNIIRSNFTVKDSKFQNIFADAFDSDFCTGLVDNVEFLNIGNDAIDFSGSEVEIKECRIQDVGDKGVSCGENSKLYVENTIVERANIAYASKDLSILKLKACEAYDAVYGLLVFQKKPEFGPARIEAQKFNSQRIDSLHLVEIASELKLNASLINGTEKQVAGRFY